MAQLLENNLPVVLAAGLNTNKAVTLGGAMTVAGAVTNNGTVTNNGVVTNAVPAIGGHGTTYAVNSTAAVTGANLKCGYLTSTSGSATAITLPTGTDLGTVLGAVQGTVFDFYVDNTAGSNTVTMVVNTNMVQSDWDLQITAATVSGSAAAITPLTVRSGVAGTAKYQVVFSSATAATFSRTA
jgi:hypothetical protein